jgi:hypothetical protein
MRPYRIGESVIALALLLGAASPAAAQGTDYQRQACTPDVFRLCGAYIPDADRITTCLRASGPQLSRPCYEVFSRREKFNSKTAVRKTRDRKTSIRDAGIRRHRAIPMMMKTERTSKRSRLASDQLQDE